MRGDSLKINNWDEWYSFIRNGWFPRDRYELDCLWKVYNCGSDGLGDGGLVEEDIKDLFDEYDLRFGIEFLIMDCVLNSLEDWEKEFEDE